MRIVYLVVCWAFALVLPAQVMITSGDLPVDNDTARYTVADPLTALDTVTSGPNQVWNFTALTGRRQAVDNFQRTADLGAIYFFLYGNSAIGRLVADSLVLGPVTLEDVLNFYKTEPNRYVNLGLGGTYLGIDFPLPYQNPDTLYKLPLAFGNQDTTTFGFEFELTIPSPMGDSLSTRFVRRGQRITHVDSWGTVQTPYDTLSCIRTRVVVTLVDSILVENVPPVRVETQQVAFEWLAPEEVIPIVSYSGVVLAGTFVPAQLRYRDVYRACLNEAPTPNFSVSASTITTEDTLTLTNSTDCDALYRWEVTPSAGVQFVDSTTSLSANPRLVLSQTGTYSIELFASTLAGTDSLTLANALTVTAVTSLEEGSASGAVPYRVFPNPFSQNLTVERLEPGRALTVELLTLAGQALAMWQSNERPDLAHLAPGVYLLRVSDGTHVWHERVVHR